MKVLVINAGSSSLKYQLIDMENEKVLAKGLAERIGIDGSQVTYQPEGGEKIEIKEELGDHGDALNVILKELLDPEVGVIEDIHEIDAIGHRTVHGGEEFTDSVKINDKVIQKLEEYSDLAPLHNPANLMGIRAMQELLPEVPQVAVFDTAFHTTMPDYAYVYSIPYEFYTDYEVRKYGFHGTSHKYVAMEAAKMIGKPFEELKIITCHLGNGSSVAAIDHGKSIDTSMGFSPLAGLVMGTRSGDIDPSILFYLNSKGYSMAQLNKILNNRSGALGISGISSDFRDIEAAANEGNERAILTLRKFCYAIITTIGSYVAAMDGCDAIVFTGGIGENSALDRAQICRNFKFMGCYLDRHRNREEKGNRFISKDDSKVKVLVIQTNEELMIARDTIEHAND